LTSKLDDDDGDGNPLDEDFPTIDDEDDDIADHAWIRDRYGVFHLFFQNEDRGSGSHIEHYTSTHLRSLDYVGTALRANPAGWDSYSLWAPHVVEDGNTYYMFYTGAILNEETDEIENIGIGYATSTDGTDWVRRNPSEPVLAAGEAGAWDDLAVAQPVVMATDTEVWMWYGGTRDLATFGWGLATGKAWYDDLRLEHLLHCSAVVSRFDALFRAHNKSVHRILLELFIYDFVKQRPLLKHAALA